MWIDICQQLPPSWTPVLVYLSEGTIENRRVGGRVDMDILRERNGKKEFTCYYAHNITHWMPLPDSPAITGKGE